ncbi:MAG: hypothetical protein ACLSVD_17005 [Eggerthellaceae bacterium]
MADLANHLPAARRIRRILAASSRAALACVLALGLSAAPIAPPGAARQAHADPDGNVAAPAPSDLKTPSEAGNGEEEALRRHRPRRRQT